MAVTRRELAWREWVLGEGRFKQHGPRNHSVRHLAGAPGRIPRTWWQRLEEFLARRDDHREKPGPHLPKPRPKKPAPAGQLTPHFNVREFDCHDGRRVPAVAVPALTRLCRDVLEPLREEFGPCTVMSGYRPADYNRRIGGATLSQHIYELTPDSVAADVIFARGTPRQWWAAANRLGVGGLGRYSSFIHVDNRPGRARWSG